MFAIVSICFYICFSSIDVSKLIDMAYTCMRLTILYMFVLFCQVIVIV